MRDNDNEYCCYFAYIGPFWFIGLLGDRRRDRKLMFHLNQGLVLFIFEMLACLVSILLGMLLRLIPVAGEFICLALWISVFILAFYLSVKGMMTVAADTKDRLPVIGRITILR